MLWTENMPRLFIKSSTAVLALLLSLTACTGGDTEPGVTADKTQLFSPSLVVPGTWAVLGSSTAAGSGASPGKSWATQMQDNTAGVQVLNLAVGGSTSYAGLSAKAVTTSGRPLPDIAHNIDAALATQPRLLLISYPSNDTALGYSAHETVQNLLSMRSLALSAGTAVMVLSTQPRRMSQELQARLIEIDVQLSAELGPCFVSLREALAGPDGNLAASNDSGDGVHPNDAGHALIWRLVSERMQQGLCVRLK